jgi:hypothetical protein
MTAPVDLDALHAGAIAAANFEKQMRDDCPAGEEPGGPYTSMKEWRTFDSLDGEVRDAYLDEARAYLGHIERAGLAVVSIAEARARRALDAAAHDVIRAFDEDNHALYLSEPSHDAIEALRALVSEEA